jgi:hypothetical protein
MQKREIEIIADSVMRLAQPGIGRKKLMGAVRREHPNASKKDVVRAAFYALIAHADSDMERAYRLHEFAMIERKSQDDEDEEDDI